MEAKMKFLILRLVLISVIFFFITGGCKTGTDEGDDLSPEAQWLRDYAVDIHSSAPDDIDFSDLQPLKQVVGNARVVLLGEQSHGDGTTFLAKARLIKFLHQEMGFDVLVFESNFYECHKAWLDMTAGMNGIDAARQAIFRVWSYCIEVEPLFQYLAQTARSSSPLELAGVDCQFSASYARQYFLDDLEQFLGQYNASILQDTAWPAFKEILARLIRYEEEPDEETLDFFFNVIDTLQAQISTFSGPTYPLLQSPAFWEQVTASIRVLAEKHWSEIDDDMIARTNLRDARMAQNFLWLYRNPYKDRKIIIWASSMHIMRYPDEIDLMAGGAISYVGLRNLGQILWEELGESIYSIAFTAGGGFFRIFSTGGIMFITPPPLGSLDWFMAEAGFEYGLVNFRDLTGGGEWLNQPLISRPIANGNATADWTRIFDGMFYMSRLEASTMRE